jgi:putative inorganic carbon (hco3(-)) transporter
MITGHSPSVPSQRLARPALSPSSALDLDLLSVRFRAFWTAIKQEPLSFWAVCAYFFVEYVRPQVILTALDVLPWGRATLGFAIVAYVYDGARTRRLQLLDGFFGFFALAWALSIVFAVDPGWSMEWAYVFFNWVLAYFLVTHIVTTPRRFYIFLALFLLWSFKLSQFGARTFALRGFVFRDWGIRGPRGWFYNSGELAVQMVIFFAMSVLFVVAVRAFLPRWKFWLLMALLPGTAALTLLGGSSRGSQLAVAGVIVVLAAQTRHRLRGAVTATLVFVALWGILPEGQKDRLRVMGEDQDSLNRIAYFHDGIQITNDYPLFGIGYKNWLPYYRRYYNPRGEVPHNIFIEASSEMGYTGLLAFLLLIGGTFVTNYRTRRLARSVPVWGPFLRTTSFGLDAALVGYVVAGSFVTILYYPYFWVSLAFTGALYETTRRAAVAARRHPAPSRTRALGSGGRPPQWVGHPDRSGRGIGIRRR